MQVAAERRDKAKEEMFLKRMERKLVISTYKDEDSARWDRRHARSPFRINLLAEEERIHEEYFIKQKEKDMQQNQIVKKKDAAKSGIIIKALSEFSDLEALRREKRAILDEEHRLRALLALEKTNATKKSDRIAAKRALQARYVAKADHRRNLFRTTLQDAIAEENMAYRRKHGLPMMTPQSTSFDASLDAP